MTKGNQVRVPGFPIAARQNFAKRHFGGEGRFGVDKAKAIGDAMDVDVNADSGKIEANSDGQVGGFASDAWEEAEFLNSVREDVIELLAEDGWEGFEMACFGVVVADGVDEAGEGLFGNAVEVGWCKSAAVGGGLEEACGGFGGAGVLCACGEDGGDEDAERVASLSFEEVDDGGWMRREFVTEDAVDDGDVVDSHERRAGMRPERAPMASPQSGEKCRVTVMRNAATPTAMGTKWVTSVRHSRERS